MHHTNFYFSTNQLLKRITPFALAFAFTVQLSLTGCASLDRKEESIEDILVKENELIGRVKAERALSEVSKGVSQSESLQVAELHLGVALDELQRANEVILTKIIETNEKEANFERHERHNR